MDSTMHPTASTPLLRTRCARKSSAIGAMVGALMLTLLPPMATISAATPRAVPPSTPRSRLVTISAVVFTGSVVTPTVTIKGTGFGSRAPAAHPSYTPAGNTAPGISYTCPSTTQPDGFDYGLSGLWLLDQGSASFSAGRYDVALNELDCIGLVQLQFRPTQIRFQLGAAYAQYGALNNWALQQGDPFTLEVKGVSYSGTVSYTR